MFGLPKPMNILALEEPKVSPLKVMFWNTDRLPLGLSASSKLPVVLEMTFVDSRRPMTVSAFTAGKPVVMSPIKVSPNCRSKLPEIKTVSAISNCMSVNTNDPVMQGLKSVVIPKVMFMLPPLLKLRPGILNDGMDGKSRLKATKKLTEGKAKFGNEIFGRLNDGMVTSGNSAANCSSARAMSVKIVKLRPMEGRLKLSSGPNKLPKSDRSGNVGKFY